MGLEYCKQITHSLTFFLHWIFVSKSDHFTAFSHNFITVMTCFPNLDLNHQSRSQDLVSHGFLVILTNHWHILRYILRYLGSSDPTLHSLSS
jgi:hypothetical protein